MKCCLTVILDGVGYRIFTKLLNSGKLPFIEEISKEGVRFEKCYSVFPSATVSGHASISTSLYPGDHGLVGQSWYWRERREFIGYDFELTMPDNWIDASTNLNDVHLLSKTWFEVLEKEGVRTFSVDLIRKGAEKKMSFITPGEDKGVAFANKLMFLRRFARHRGVKSKSILKKLILKLFPFHTLQHEIAVMNALKAVKAGCRFGVVWFMETDAASHLFGPDSFEGEEGKPYIYDSAEDAIRDADEELEKLYKKLPNPVLAIVTDHGQVRLNKGRKYHVDLAEMFEKEGINAFTNIDPAEYEKRSGRRGEVIFASSGPRMSHIYLLDEKRREDVFEALRNCEAVEHVFFRKGEIYVADEKETLPISEYEFGSEFPMAKEKIEGLMRSSRCGDFVIAARKGYEFEKSEYKGAHGGLHFDESTGIGIIHVPGKRENVVEEGMIMDVIPIAVREAFGFNPITQRLSKNLNF